MKKVNLKSSLKAGFSLVEMLVVIAIIGIIAAIAIPNIGNINDSARQASAKRNAQSIASVVNAAIAAGADVTAITDKASLITAAQKTGDAALSPGNGPFKGKKFTVGPIDSESVADVEKYLDWDNEDKQAIYKAEAATSEEE